MQCTRNALLPSPGQPGSQQAERLLWQQWHTAGTGAAAHGESPAHQEHPAAPTPVPKPTVPLQINLATSPAAAQLLNRAQSVNPGASGIAQQAVLLGNATSPALTASQAQMYLRAQMVRVAQPHGTVGQLGAARWPSPCSKLAQTHRKQML